MAYELKSILESLDSTGTLYAINEQNFNDTSYRTFMYGT